ncbi:MAG TPA: FtsK/SpoIIIE domain-containing protein, partial [Isosphaeraceae bacterium]|nr:FtsK/SpoIIIE domain-containing protein [Isosphaeraceae bacterium]
MAVRLTVRDVRDALYWSESGSRGQGASSNRVLGRMFHEVFADLVGNDPRRSMAAALLDIDADPPARRQALVDHAYRRLVGPRLRAQQANLHLASREVVRFWSAVESLCDWLSRLPGIEGHTRVEQSLSARLRAPEWTDDVLLSGVADAVIRLPSGRWCVVELKLGQTAPEADLGQTYLYHQILESQDGVDSGSLALVSFTPELQERLFESNELAQARDAMLDLVGRLAGVKPPANGQNAAAPPEIQAPPPELVDMGRRLVDAFSEYGLNISLASVPILGPTFVRFPIDLGEGVKLGSLQQRYQEIQIRLQLDQPPRIDLDGRRVVVDVQRPDRQIVPFSSIAGQLQSLDSHKGSARVPVGVDLDGNLRCADLERTEHAHLLVAGTTGSGKSEWLRVAVAGLIRENSPETLKLVLIDPKYNAFSWLKGSPFLLRPIVHPSPSEPISRVLSELADEMERRYRLMHESDSDSLAEHIERTGCPLPRIVCVCDEYADLILGDKEERKAIEAQISRLGAKARASGIHLILAT